MSFFKVRSAYDYDSDAASVEAALSCPEDEDQAQQQFKEEVDINTIVRRFGVTGLLPAAPMMPMVGDFTMATSFHESVEIVRRAEEEFMTLPASLRKEFGNDPGALIAFLEDPGNRERAIELGLIDKPAERPREEPGAPAA